MIVGHASNNDDFCYAIAGTKVRKMHSSRRDAFKPMNRKPFAKIYPVAPLGVPQIAECGGIEVLSEYKIRNKHKVVIDTKVEEKVALLKYYPGQDPNILDYYLEKGYKGLVLEMGALGHVATMRARNGWTRKLKEVQEKGLIVCATTQCLYGRTNPLVYSNGRELMETGIIYLEDMLSETAFVKLGWVLGHKDWSDSREKIKEKMLENFSWETNPRLEE
jgi:glutamyl-tRNA(Gln) amidotransferase subunit D